MNEKIKFAVVGAGHIGKRHAEMIISNPESQLTSVCDIDPEREKEIKSYGVPFYSSINDLLKNTGEKTKYKIV